MKQVVLPILKAAMQVVLWVLKRVDYYFGQTVTSLNPLDSLIDPYPGFNAVREKGPILRSYMNNGWIVTGYKEVTEFLRDQRVSNDFGKNAFMVRIVRLAAGDVDVLNIDNPTMLGQDPPDHTRLRKLVAKGFLHRYIQSLAPTIEQLVDDLLDEIDLDSGQFDVMQSLARPLPAIVIAEMMGVPASERHLFERWSEQLLGGTDLGNPALIRKGGEANMEMRAYLAELAERKRGTPGQDLISQLIMAEEDGDKLTVDELYSNCILLLVAGHETTTRLIGNCLYLLLHHPEQMEVARQSEENLVNALEESLRYEPPVQFTARIVKESMTVNDCKLKQGQMLMLSIAAANRDPAANENPDVFDIKRKQITHVSFGYGIHLCLGMSLARLEAKIVFNRLFDRFPELVYLGEKPNWGTNPMFRGVETLLVGTSISGVEEPLPVERHVASR